MRFPGGTPTSLASFSSQGPSVGDLAIKPDLVATGTAFYTAAVYAPAGSCSLCDPSGYVSVQGTSFSAPLTAGAAAVLKAARPGLASDDYRSLLINSTSPMILTNGSTANVMAAGSGILNLKNALSSPSPPRPSPSPSGPARAPSMAPGSSPSRTSEPSRDPTSPSIPLTTPSPSSPPRPSRARPSPSAPANPPR